MSTAAPVYEDCRASMAFWGPRRPGGGGEGGGEETPCNPRMSHRDKSETLAFHRGRGGRGSAQCGLVVDTVLAGCRWLEIDDVLFLLYFSEGVCMMAGSASSLRSALKVVCSRCHSDSKKPARPRFPAAPSELPVKPLIKKPGLGRRL